MEGGRVPQNSAIVRKVSEFCGEPSLALALSQLAV